MIKFLVFLSLVFNFQVFSQTVLEVGTATTLSPFSLATRIMESSMVAASASFGSLTPRSIEERGVAGKEQLKDEMVALNDDIIMEKVKTIEEVRQPALRELFLEIESNADEMAFINNQITVGSKLQKVATAVTLNLFSQN